MNKTAVQLFADVLEGDNGKAGSGDVKKLLANMSKSKYELKDIVKVLDSLESRVNKDSLAKMLGRPTAELNELQTSTQRFFEELNNEGGLKLQTKGLDLLTYLVKQATKAIKPVMDILKSLFNVIKVGGEGIWEYFIKPVGVVIAYLKEIPYLAEAVCAALITMGLVTTSTTVATTGLGTAFKTLGLFVRRFLILPIVAAAALGLFLQVIGALQGHDNYFTKLTEDKDKGIFGWLAAIVRQASEAIKLLGVLSFATGGLLFGSFKGTKGMTMRESNAAAIKEYTQILGMAWDDFAGTAIKTGIAPYIGVTPPEVMPQNQRPLSMPAGFIPNLIALPDPQTQGYTGGITMENNFTINGTNLTAEDIARAVTDKMNSDLGLAAANYSNLVMRR